MPAVKSAKKSKPATKKSAKKGKITKAAAGPGKIDAKNFIERLKAMQSDKELEKIQRYFKSGKGEYGEGDVFIGVRMGGLFKLSEEFIDMTPDEIEKLLESPIHEVRAGAVSIMNKQGRSKKTTESRRKELYDLYLRRHDRINNWDLVDLGAAFVIGRYLFDKPRKVLYKLACSKDVWERRTAIVSTSYFIRNKQLDDTFEIAGLLVDDEHDLIQKAAGGWIREAGKQNRQKLLAFLDRHAATMPRTFLRYAIEHFDRKLKDHYMGLKDSIN
jgi:3-methyladenine DNA glycosylase AlkD